MVKEASPAEPERSDRRLSLEEERTLLEHERTLAAWIRTGLAAVALGLAAAELLRALEPQWLTQAIGMALITAGGVLLVRAYQSYRGSIERLRNRGVPGIARWALLLFLLVLVLSAAAMLYLLVA